MNPTHYLYLATPPRQSFVADATPEEYQILGQHFAYMDQVRERGQLLLTGPALDGSWGVAIFKVTTQEEAEALMRADPAIQVGLFTGKVHPLAIGPITP
jgi:uncharacterized protein YciI